MTITTPMTERDDDRRGDAGRGHDQRGMRGAGLLVTVLLAVYTYAFIDRVILALLVEPIRHDLGASDLHMGLLLGLGFALFYAVLSIPAGHFVDRFNRRAMIGVASLIWALMTIVCGTSMSLAQMFLGRAGVGIAESVIMPAAFSLIRDGVPARLRGLAFSIYAMAPVIGSTTSLLGGGYLLRAAAAGRFSSWPLLAGLAPWQSTMTIVGVLGLPLGLLLLLVREPARAASLSAPDAGRPRLLDGFGDALRYMRSNLRIYFPLIAYVTFGAMSNFSNTSWLPAMIGRTWGLAPQQVGPLLGMILLPSGLAGLLVSGVVLNRLAARGGDIRNYGIIAATGTMIGLVAAPLASTLTGSLVMSGIGTFFLGTSYAVGASTLSQITPVRLMGRMTAIYFLFQTLLGQAFGPFLVALGSQRLFVGRAALAHSLAMNCAAFGIATIAAALLLKQRLRQRGRLGEE